MAPKPQHKSLKSRYKLSTFVELNLSEQVFSSITELGYKMPSPIQSQTLPILLTENTDFIGLAATGTGKTAAFTIPLIEKINTNSRTVQALILCPTRELAIQVAGQVDLIGKHKGVRSVAIYGGSSYDAQIRGIKQGAAVVVGTPGRLVDLISKGYLKLESLKTIVLDEADEMISMGFKEDLENILKESPSDSCNIWLFSATMSSEVRRVADTYLQNPKQVRTSHTEVLSNTVEQLYYPTHEANKPEILCKLVDAADNFYGLVFCQTKSLVTDLTSYLIERGYKVDCLHGDKDQVSREKTMRAFRERKVNILVCTDVASRGLDVKDITHVINYSIPREIDVYVHRIGRTARSGKSGFAINLVTPSHRSLIFRIEKVTKSKMKEGKLPSRKDIGTKKVSALLGKFQSQGASYAKAVELLDETWTKALGEMSKEEIAGRFLSLIHPDIFVDREKSATPSIRRDDDRKRSSGGGNQYRQQRRGRRSNASGGGGGWPRRRRRD